MLSKLKMMKFTKGFNLSFTGRVVLSYLAYRARLQKGATGNKIATELRLSQSKCVTPALKELVAKGLIVKTSKGWKCNELTSAVFLEKSKYRGGTDWTTRYGFYFVRIPQVKSKLSMLQSVMYGYLVNREKSPKRVTTSFGLLATVLGITKGQARYNYNKLIALGLICTGDVGHGNFVVKSLPLGDREHIFFRPETMRERRVIVPHSYKPNSTEARIYNRYTEGAYGFTSNQAHQLIDWLRRVGKDATNLMVALDTLEKVAREAHSKNVKAGKRLGAVGDYYPLLWSFLVEHMANRYELHSAEVAKAKVLR